jgi:hypothetical protein
MSEITHIQKRVHDSTLQMVMKKGTIKDALLSLFRSPARRLSAAGRISVSDLMQT